VSGTFEIFQAGEKRAQGVDVHNKLQTRGHETEQLVGNAPSRLVHRSIALFFWGAMVSGCGGGGGHTQPISYTVGGSISGLTTSGLILANGSDTVSPAANATSFTFPTRSAAGKSYSVSVQSQPAGETCTTSTGAGSVGSANVTSIAVTCVSETILYSFAAPTDGALPLAGLIQGSDGNFYGTTEFGGTGHRGTVFTITPTGDETVLHSFTGTSGDGATPVASLVQGVDGNFYGTTSVGGANSATCTVPGSCGTVFKITPSGAVTVLHSFTGTGGDGANPVASLIQGSDGNFYGTTNLGGANSATCTIAGGCGSVFKITPTGVETVLHSFTGAGGDGATPDASLLQGSDGNFYGTTSYGGAASASFADGCGTVFTITPTGVETVLYAFQCTGGDGVDPLAGLTLGNDGNFYGTTYLGGASGEGTVFKITPAGVETVLYSFNGGACGDDINPAVSLTQGSDGNFYGTTSGNTNSCGQGTVFKITPTGVESVLYAFKGDISLGANPHAGVIQGSDGNLYGTTEYGGAGENGTVFKLSY
jgi:uncharacterized repeat protein (TIGR03803 family)